MARRVKLSICIPVYNQIELVTKCIDTILNCKSEEIEIVINDDCSTEPIEQMVKLYGDDRLQYYRNERNLGHDRNIISSFRRARANFVFLLRTRDLIIPKGLDIIIEFISSTKNIAYLTTSCYDSIQCPKIIYENRIYSKGKEALDAHNGLYVHPSGSVYNVSLINLDEIDQFLDDIRATKYNFTVHSLIRMLLTTKGSFVTLSDYSWIYSDTADAKEVAVNSSKKNISVYDTEYELERYRTEAIWCNRIFEEPFKTHQLLQIFSNYLYATTWNNRLLYEDRRLRNHYNYKYKRINCKHEREKFLKYANKIEQELTTNDEQYYQIKAKIIRKNIIIDRFKYYLIRIKSSLPAKKVVKRILFKLVPAIRKVN